LKLSDGRFYVGQTSDLIIRLQEHRDGMQRQTKKKYQRLAYYESFEGNRDSVNEREAELAKMNQSGFGHLRLRQMIKRCPWTVEAVRLGGVTALESIHE